MSAVQRSRLQFAETELSTGVRIHYAHQGPVDGQPVIFLHGFTDSWFSFRPILPLLPSPLRCFAVSHRGHGDSDRPPVGYSLSELSSDIMAFMNDRELASAVLVGHSMSSLVALDLALTAPERLQGIVLIGSATHIRSGVIRELEQAVSGLSDPVPREFIREFQESTIFAPVTSEFLETVIAESAKLSAGVWRAVLAGLLAVDYTDKIGNIRVPSLCLRGDQDALFDPAAQQALERGLPRTTIRMFRDTGHALHWERPVECVRELQSFFNALPC